MNRNQYELYHYGVKGMKWGVRHDYEPKGREHSKKSEPSDEKKFKLTDKQKKYIKIGAAVAATALVAYGGYKFAKSDKFAELVEAGKGWMRNKNGSNIDVDTEKMSAIENARKVKTELKRQAKQMSAIENARRVNPDYSLADQSSFMNCGNCTIGMELRMRGYDVQALGNDRGMTFSQFASYFTGYTSESFHNYSDDLFKLKLPDSLTRFSDRTAVVKAGKAVESALKKAVSDNFSDSDARGALFFTHANGSHWINWVKRNGNVEFYDAQNPKVNLTEVFGMYYEPSNRDLTRMIRLDNLDINEESIREVVRNAGERWRDGDFDLFVTKGKDFVLRTPGL